ncbi:MAG: hypothetical protein OXF41_10595 [bacterium]|nr:hypothetical protein [bacterium]
MIRTGTSLRNWTLFLMLLVLMGPSCRREQPQDDVEYLTREVSRQVRIEGRTADEVSGILIDATRHGTVVDRIEAECGDEVAMDYSAANAFGGMVRASTLLAEMDRNCDITIIAYQ